LASLAALAFWLAPRAEAQYLATGGDIKTVVTNNAGTSSQIVYCVHQFTNTAGDTFTPSQDLTVQYLVIGGGGGGSTGVGGGGGAGGYRCSVMGELSGGNSVAEPLTNLTSGVGITVSVGGGGGADSAGGNSEFGAISALGGGYGGPGSGWAASGPGGTGGSGGGGYYNGAATTNPG